MLSVVFFLIAYAVIALVCVPLAMRLIPPNPIYGFRTRRTVGDPALWYNVNAVGGQLMLVACGLGAIILMMYQGTLLRSFWVQLFIFLVFVGGAIGATLYFERKGGSWK